MRLEGASTTKCKTKDCGDFVAQSDLNSKGEHCPKCQDDMDEARLEASTYYVDDGGHYQDR